MLVLYPIYFTVKVAFTNYGTGHLMTKQEAIERILFDPNYTYVPESAEPVEYMVFSVFNGLNPTEDFVVLFEKDGNIYIADAPLSQRGVGKRSF
nr:hypothetical protein [Thermotoga maritima]